MKQKYLEQIWTYICSRCRGKISFLIYVDKKERKIPAHLYPNLCDPMDCSPPGTSVHGILQARIMEGVAIFFPTQGCNPHLLHLLHWQADSSPSEPLGKVLYLYLMWWWVRTCWRNRTFLLDSELIRLWEDILLWATVRAYTGARLNLCVWGSSLNPLQRID